MSNEENEIKCWHKEIDQNGICKNCGARAAIELEGLHPPNPKTLDMLRVSHSPEGVTDERQDKAVDWAQHRAEQDKREALKASRQPVITGESFQVLEGK